MATSDILLSGQAAAKRTMRPVRIWLLAIAGLVLLMVTVGGATRLTGSGLSITEWKPIVGLLPPLSAADWHDAFERYRQIPQYHHVNRGMSLDEFKFIFWWEWAHRNLGRFMGLAFAIPFAGFLAAGYISRGLMLRLAGIFALGGLQGFVGWYMVSSGLTDRIDVSPYRLAFHLGLAILIFGALLWVALTLRPPDRDVRSKAASYDLAALSIAALVFLQVLLGAFVAGLKAGHAYNTWPLMDGRLVPQGLGAMEPWYLNIFENALTAQFDHRMVAYLLTAAVLWRFTVVMRPNVDPRTCTSGVWLTVAVLAQVALGIWTLVTQVPLALGIAHQALAAVVFGIAIWHLYESSSAPPPRA